MILPLRPPFVGDFPAFVPSLTGLRKKPASFYVRAAATFLRGTRSKAIILVVVRHGAFPVALDLTLQKGMYTHEQSYTVHVGKSIPESWLISCTFWAGVFHNRTNQVLSH
jgi:hypothetical protein